MWGCLLAVCGALLQAAALEVEADTLQGTHVSGELSQISAGEVVLKATDGERVLPQAELLEIRATASRVPDVPPLDPVRVTLVDGTSLICSSFSASGGAARIETPACGSVSVPLPQVATVRFGASLSRLDEAWSQLLQRGGKKDLLVLRKDDVLDFLSGVVGDVDAEKVQFVLDGDDIPVNRNKVHGIIYARRPFSGKTPAVVVSLASGDVLQGGRVSLEEGRLTCHLLSGVELRLPIERVQSVDLSGGKLKYLSQLEPREYKFTPFFPTDEKFFFFQYHRDRNLEGGPLRIGDRVFARGLAMHSKTLLRYRLPGEFRRFRAIMGIDPDLKARRGDVHVTLRGDGRPLYEGDVKEGDAPLPLDLDVAGVRDFEILVDFGRDNDTTGDRLHLGDARFVK